MYSNHKKAEIIHNKDGRRIITGNFHPRNGWMTVIENSLLDDNKLNIGDEIFLVNGVLTSENDEPALIRKNGDKLWFKNNKIHRDKKPAIIFNGKKKNQYWENGKKIN